jgi:hypothetical protein
MLISHRKKFIYTKTAKTAGTSVEVFFEKYCMPEGEWIFSHERDQYISESGVIGFRGELKEKILHMPKFYNHMPASDIKAFVGDNIWDEYFKFCVIRNPFEKVLSGFFFRVVNNVFDDTPRMISAFRDWVKSQNGMIAIDRHAYLIDGLVSVDFFIKQENLLEDVKKVCKIIDVPFYEETFPQLKTLYRPKNAKIEDYYDNETKEIVLKSYAFEFENFKYNPSINTL